MFRSTVLRPALQSSLCLLQDGTPLTKALERAGFDTLPAVLTTSLHTSATSDCPGQHCSAGGLVLGMRWPASQLDTLVAQPVRKGRRCRCNGCATLSGDRGQNHWLHTAVGDTGAPSSSTAPTHKASHFEYTGPLSVTLKRLKLLSISSCAFTLLGSPLIVQMGTAATSVGGKAAIAIGLASFGLFTTGLLHWFTGPYVHHLTYSPDEDQLILKTLSFAARPVHHRVHLSELQHPQTMRPQATFQAQGTIFYVDADSFADKDLLSRLTIPEPAPS